MMRPAPSAGSSSGMLEGQVAVITGSGQGIGAAAALLFAQHGAAITVCDIDATKAQNTASSILSSGGRAIVVAGDVMDPAYADRVVAETLKAFGKVFALRSFFHATSGALILRRSTFLSIMLASLGML